MELTIVTPETYVIFEHGGKQYQGIPGKTVALEKIEGEAGNQITLDKVLLSKKNNKIEVGQPFLKDFIKASIVKQMRGPKVIVFKFKRRKKYRNKTGHRQSITVVRIESI